MISDDNYEPLLVNIFDMTCQHQYIDNCWTSSLNKKPKRIRYVQRQQNFDGVTIFTDSEISRINTNYKNVASKWKIAWCLESPAVNYDEYNKIEQYADHFDYVFTYRDDLIRDNPQKFIAHPPACAWIPENEFGLYKGQKNKLSSIILSNRHKLPGHQMRHKIINSGINVDAYGSGCDYGFVPNNKKLVAHKNYMFSYIVENTKCTHYFSEKLIDCLVAGCVPIYCGAPNIGDYFNLDGFIIFDCVEDLENIKITEQDYIDREKAIKENFEIAKKYNCNDDILAEKILRLIQ